MGFFRNLFKRDDEDEENTGKVKVSGLSALAAILDEIEDEETDEEFWASVPGHKPLQKHPEEDIWKDDPDLDPDPELMDADGMEDEELPDDEDF